MGLQRMPVQRFGGINVIDPPYDLDADQARDLINVRPTSLKNVESIESRGGAQYLETPDDSSATPAGGVFNSYKTASGFSLLFDGEGKAYSCYERTVGANAAGKMTLRYAPTPPYSGVWEACSLDTGYNDGTDFALMVPKRISILTGSGIDSGGVTPRAYWCRDHSVTSFSGDSVVNAALASTRSLVTWRNRVFSIYAWTNLQTLNQTFSRIHYSEPAVFANWGPPNTLRILDSTSSLDCKLVVHNNNLYLFKERSVWMIYDPNTLFNRLICNEGMGDISNADAALSCTLDGRLYWFNVITGDLWSSNGETDMVLENRLFPIRPGYYSGFTSQLQPALIEPHKTSDNTRLGRCRLVYDPERESILLFFPATIADGSDPDTSTYVMELLLRGKPGEHPIYLHKYSPRITHAGLMGKQLDLLTPGSLGNTSRLTPRVFHSHPVTSGKTRTLFWTFGDSTGSDYVSGDGDGTTKAPYPAFWKSGWKPFASEEPVERVRRINLGYRGALALKYYASDDPSFFVQPGLKTWQSADLSYVSGDQRDRDFTVLRPPNYRGRYHAFDLIADTDPVPTERFRVSMVEFVLRGGRSKK